MKRSPLFLSLALSLFCLFALLKYPQPELELTQPNMSDLDTDRYTQGAHFVESIANLDFERPDAVEQALDMARERKKWFLQLMHDDPVAAWEQAMPRWQRARLPDAIQPFVEERHTVSVGLGLSWVTHTNGGHSHHGRHSCDGHQVLEIEAHRWDVLHEGNRDVVDPMNNVPVQALTLGTVALLAPGSVELLEDPMEIAYVRAHYSEAPTGDTDPVSGERVVDGLVGLLNGELYVFESMDSVEQVEAAISSRLLQTKDAGVVMARFDYPWLTDYSGGSSGGADDGLEATPYMADNINVLFVRVDFEDMPGEPIAKADLEATLASANDRIIENSYGQASVSYTVSDTVYRVDFYDLAHYATTDDMYGMQLDVTAAIRQEGIHSLGDYDIIGIYFASMSDIEDSVVTYGGKATIGVATGLYSSGIWINGVNNTNVLTHELGHNYGAKHANYWHPSEAELPGEYEAGSLEYGDIYDVMGRGTGAEAHMNPYTKNRLQWIPDSKVTEVTMDGTYRVYRFDDAAAIALDSLALKVSSGEDSNYWVSLREAFTNPLYNLSAAAYVVAEGFHGEDESDLIDTTPDSGATEALDRQDAALEVGQSFYDAERGVRITTMAAGGVDPAEWIDVSVDFDSRIGFTDTSIDIDEQQGQAFLEVQRTNSTEGEVVVAYASSSVSATDGLDFYGVSGLLTWADGDDSVQRIVVPIRPDNNVEGVENFTVSLTPVTNAVIDPDATLATISILEPGDMYEYISASLSSGWFTDVLPTDDGKVFAVGDFDGFGDTAHISGIVRFNSDGSLDESFVTTTGFHQSKVNAIIELEGGDLIAVGEFELYEGVSCKKVVRIHPDGSLDESFQANIGTGANTTVNCIVQEAAGTIVIGGQFTDFNGTAVDGLIRLNPDGTAAANAIDPYYRILGLSGAGVESLVVRENGNLLVGGKYLYYSSSPRQSGIFSIQPDGSADAANTLTRGAADSSSGTSMGSVYAIAESPDGKIYIGGGFNYYGGTAMSKLARLNADSTLDTGFTSPGFAYSPGGGVRINAIYPQIDGKVIVAGRFDSPKNYIVRLNADGSVDESFDPGIGFDRSISSLKVDAEGALWCAGIQFHYDGVDQNDLSKIAPGVSPYDRWAAEQFGGAEVAAGLAAADADADGDGLKNALELAIGSSPVDSTEGDDMIADAFQTNLNIPDQTALRLELKRTGFSDGLWVTAQFSDDLVNWEPTQAVPGTNGIYTVLEDSAERICFEDKSALVDKAKRFGRIVFSLPE